jgi:hypothetical protein
MVQHHPQRDAPFAMCRESRPQISHWRVKIQHPIGHKGMDRQGRGRLGAGKDTSQRISLPCRCIGSGTNPSTPQIDHALPLMRDTQRGTYLAALGKIRDEGLRNSCERGAAMASHATP